MRMAYTLAVDSSSSPAHQAAAPRSHQIVPSSSTAPSQIHYRVVKRFAQDAAIAPSARASLLVVLQLRKRMEMEERLRRASSRILCRVGIVVLGVVEVVEEGCMLVVEWVAEEEIEIEAQAQQVVSQMFALMAAPSFHIVVGQDLYSLVSQVVVPHYPSVLSSPCSVSDLANSFSHLFCHDRHHIFVRYESGDGVQMEGKCGRMILRVRGVRLQYVRARVCSFGAG